MRILLALTVLALAVSPLAATQADEENVIRELQARWDEAWNRNDVKALSSLVAEDVRFVNVAGQVLTGRREFEQLQTRTHATQFKESVRTVTGTDIKFLTPDMNGVCPAGVRIHEGDDLTSSRRLGAFRSCRVIVHFPSLVFPAPVAVG